MEALIQQTDMLSLTCPETKDAINVYFEKVTPALAKQLLDTNHKNNRKIKDKIVNNYAKQMNDGLWHPSSGEVIKLTQSGTLIDGQHRLTAITRCKKPYVWMMFISGIPEKAFTAIDDGIARTLADALTINGVKVKASAQRVASALRALYMMHESLLRGATVKSMASIKLSTTEIIMFHKELKGFNESLDHYMGNFVYTSIQSHFNTPVSMVMYYLFKDINAEVAFSVLKSFELGTPFDDLKHKSAAYHIVQRVRKARDLKIMLRVHDYINFFLWAYVRVRDNKEVTYMPKEMPNMMESDDKDILQMRQKIKAI